MLLNFLFEGFTFVSFKAVEEAKMEDKVRKMQQLKDKEKEELFSTLQNGEWVSKRNRSLLSVIIFKCYGDLRALIFGSF